MPEPSVNLLSWLRPEEIHVAFAGATWQLEATTAADWLGAIAYDFKNLSGVFPGLVAESDLDAMMVLLLDPARQEGLVEVARKVVEAASGRDWWWTVNLTQQAVAQWMYINGFLVRQGVRADSTSLPDWLDACYTWLWDRGSENQRATLDAQLCLPPRGVKVRGGQITQMLAEFAAD